MTPATQASSDIEILMTTGIELARERLESGGGFAPFGLTIAVDHDDDDDEIDFVEAGSDEGEINEEQALDALVEAFGENLDAYRGVAVVFDAVIDDEWDAVTVLIAHVDAEPIDVQLPYRVSGSKRLYADVEQSEGSLEFWND